MKPSGSEPPSAPPGQPGLPVRREQPQRVPALGPPRVRHLTALEDHVVDRAFGEAAAHRQAGVAGADDHGGDVHRHGGPRQVSDVDDDVGRVGHDVEHRRPLLRLGDERLDLFGRRVGVDVEAHGDAAEAVADVGIGAEDAEDVHVALDRRRDRAQLDPAILGHGGDAGGEATASATSTISTGVAPWSSEAKHSGWSASNVNGTRGCAPGRGRRSRHGRLAVGAVAPTACRAPGELGGLGCRRSALRGRRGARRC